MRRWLAPLLIVGSALFSVAMYSRLPARMPVHWNFHGEIDRYGSPLEGAFFFPAMMLLLWGIMRLLPRIDPRRANYAKFADTYSLLVNSLMALFAVMHVALIGVAAFVLGVLSPS